MAVFVKLVCIGILLSFVLSFAQISVEVKDEQPYNPSMLGLRARVVNNSGQSYDNVTVNILLKKVRQKHLRWMRIIRRDGTARLRNSPANTLS